MTSLSDSLQILVASCVLIAGAVRKAQRIGVSDSMKKATLIILACICFALSASAQSNGEITVKFGKTKVYGKGRVSVKFVELIEDSRCPENLNCIWAGVARVKVELVKNGKKGVFELGTNGSAPAIFQGYTVVIKNLDPYPSIRSHSKTADYALTLTLSTAKN